MNKLPQHLFISESDGAMYDTRIKGWNVKTALRPNYRRTHSTIGSVADFKATLRNGPYAWPGGYPMHFICEDGESLCFECGRKEFRNIVGGIADRKRGYRTGWAIVACDINYEDTEMHCAHCSKPIESAYGED